jgi:KDO2-lipid IV(A) lauroyltransferase
LEGNTGEVLGKSPFFFRCVEYAFLGVFHLTRLVSYALPPAAVAALFDALEAFIFHAQPAMRRRLEAKITEALPEAARAGQAASVTRDVCGSLLRPMQDLILFSRHGDRFMRELRVEGLEHLERADAAGKGVILAGGHLGLNALRIGMMARLGKHYTPIFLFPGDSPVNNYYMSMLDFGQRLGCDPEEPVFWTGQDTVKRVREHLRRGKRVGIDFDIPGKCVVEFLGKPAALADGIARFALDTGAAIVPFLLRRGSGVFDNRLIFYEPLQAGRTGDHHDDVRALMQEVARAGEKMVREAPGQWESWFTIRQFWEMAREAEEG